MKKLIFLFLMVMNTGVYAVDQSVAVGGCTDIRSSIQRLACFDKLFDTPIYLDAVRIPEVLQPSYGIVDVVNKLESQRETDNYDLFISVSVEHSDTEQRRVVLTAPAIGAIGVRPILALSCIDNISRLQMIFSQPLDKTRVNLAIQNKKDKQVLSEEWKVIGGGYIVDAGRGIPSIRIIQRLKDSKRITFSSDQSSVEGLVFDLEALPKYIVELATACHWRGTNHLLSGAKRD